MRALLILLVAISTNAQVSKIAIQQQELCYTNTGFHNQYGEFEYCWSDVEIPSYTGSVGVAFANSTLKLSNECDYQAISIDENNLLTFSLNPRVPDPTAQGGWCTQSFNKRAEISVDPWDSKLAELTEEWFSWSVHFPDDFQTDTDTAWAIFQIKPIDTAGQTVPPISLQYIETGTYGSLGGELHVLNYPNNDRIGTGIVSKAGDQLDIVMHVVHGRAPDGLLQVWMNGNLVYDEEGISTVYPEVRWAGNPKWGLYCHEWNTSEGVEDSEAQGIFSRTIKMGNLKRKVFAPTDPLYRTDQYYAMIPN